MTECEFTVTLKEYSKLLLCAYSDVYEFGPYRWKLKYYPCGNKVEDLSVYLVVDGHEQLPEGWRRTCNFWITLVNHKDKTKSITKDGTFTFRKGSIDRGFNQLTDRKLKHVLDPKNGFLVKDSLTIHCKVVVISDTIDNSIPNSICANNASKHDPKFVGLKNQGATCYLNSFMQALFILGAFRKAVYQIPIEPDAVPTSNIPLALQRLYYQLQTSDSPVSTYELTRSFGWNQDATDIQQDIQEFSRVLQDTLETKMKGTSVEGTIEKLFRGETYNYIECVKVDFKSVRREFYYDISLNVRGCSDLMASFRKYCEVELLDNENMYNAGKYGMQKARKGILFNSFPPVLLLHLKRFDFDYRTQRYEKINDKHVFPPVLKLNEFLSPESDRSIDYTYHLHGVLVHSGGAHGGHYYAFLKPTTGPQWYKFDDSVVTKVSAQLAIDDNFGGVETSVGMYSSAYKKVANAYMLMYILESKRAEILTPVDPTDIPPHLAQQFEEERLEKERMLMEQQEQLSYMTVRLVLEEDLKKHHGIDLVDFATCKAVKVKRDSPFSDLIPIVEQALNIPRTRFRLWDWQRRTNTTIRPDTPYSENAMAKPMRFFDKGTDLPVYVEVAPVIDGQVGSFVSDKLLFVKFYDPATSHLQFIGTIECSLEDTMLDLQPKINAMLGRPAHLPLMFFEEVKPDLIDPIQPNTTLKDAELDVGDIITVQIPISISQHFEYKYPEAKDYYAFLVNKIEVEFRLLEKPNLEGFTLELQKNMKYSQWIAELGKRLGWDPACIRVTSALSPTQPAHFTISNNDYQTLETITRNARVIFYELFHVEVEKISSYYTYTILWRDMYTNPVERVKVHVPRYSSQTIADIIDQLKSPLYSNVVKLTMSREIRLFRTWGNKIDREYEPTLSTTMLSEYNEIVAEEVPEDEIQSNPMDQRVYVAHYIKVNNTFEATGNPFIMLVKYNEQVRELKQRLRRRLGWSSDKAFNLCRMQYTTPEYLNDDDILTSKSWIGQTHLGIEHALTDATRTTRTAKRGTGIQIFG